MNNMSCAVVHLRLYFPKCKTYQGPDCFFYYALMLTMVDTIASHLQQAKAYICTPPPHSHPPTPRRGSAPDWPPFKML